MDPLQSGIFFNRIAIAVYVLVFLLPLLITARRFWQHRATAGFVAAIRCFLATFLVIALTSAILAAILFSLSLNALAGKTGMGGAIVFVLLAPAACGLIALIAATFLGWYVSWFFWPRDTQTRLSSLESPLPEESPDSSNTPSA